MPAPIPPPQTSKQAKRAYQKSSKGFRFTASQERAASRRNAKDEYARKLREKEERSRLNKRRRDEKEEKEREAKKRLVEKGQLPEDALLPKVSASQPRLNLFIRHPPKSVAETLPPLLPRDGDDETVKADSDNEDTLVDDNRPAVPSPFNMNEKELEKFFSTAPSEKDEMMAKRNTDVEKVVARPSPINDPQHLCEPVPEMSKDELEAQLGCPLSQAVLDFDICEDPLSDTEQAPTVIPSTRKRKRSQDGFATPSKSARSALSEMSPAKVFLRSQEKPDTTSAPSVAARILSPRQEGSCSSQFARKTRPMISMQDIADDTDFSAAKENTDPGRAIPSQRQSLGCSPAKSASDALAGPGKALSTKAQETDEYEFDNSAFDDIMDNDEGDDYYDTDITDAEWAGLSTQPPKNTAVSSLGSPKKAKAFSIKTPCKSMAPPPRPSPVEQLVTKFQGVTPKKPKSPTAVEEEMPPASQSSNFDDGISDADLASLSAQMPTVVHELSPKSPPTFIARSSHPAPLPASKQMLNNVPADQALTPAPLVPQEAPPASQSFGLDDGMEDSMLALVEEIDFAGSSATKKAKNFRTLPWENRPANWNAMMAEGEQNEAPEGLHKHDA